MKYRSVFCFLLLFVAVSVHAQFVGDSLAAAGFNISEEEAMAGLSAIAAQRAARTPPPPPPPPPQTASMTRAPEPAPVAPLAAQGPGGAGFTGGGKVTTVEDVEAYKAAFRPVGTSLGAPPAGSETVKVGSSTYAYFLGVFYQQKGQVWVVVAAPVGAVVTGRPAGASMIVFAGKSYLYYNGAFFAWNGGSNTAQVVAPPAGAVVTYVPETAVKQDRNGQTCYVYGGACFSPKYRGTTLVYVVA